MNTTPIGWVAVAAILLGLFVRAIKSDAIKVALANFGLPPVPTRALPWLALGLGCVGAILDAKVGGASWNEAAQAGVVAAAGAVFGHELLSGVPGVRRLLAVGLLIVPLSVTSCALFTPKNVKSALTIAQISCIFATTLTDAPEVARVCGVADDLIPVVRDLVGQREGARKAGVVWHAAAGAP
jgi:hypothetical protein